MRIARTAQIVGLVPILKEMSEPYGFHQVNLEVHKN
jgi:hypothetical protein